MKGEKFVLKCFSTSESVFLDCAQLRSTGSDWSKNPLSSVSAFDSKGEGANIMIPPLITVPRARNMQLMHSLSQSLRFLLNLKAFNGLFFYELAQLLFESI